MASTRFPTARLSRRSFLAGPMAATVLALQGRNRAAAAPLPMGPDSRTGVDRVYRKLRGPVVPINIPLAKDYSVDYGNLRSYVDFLCENQAPVIFFTHGSSEFKSMSEHEIEKLCRTAAEQARGRALVIGGTGKWWTGKSIDFIRRLEDSGVDGSTCTSSPRSRRRSTPLFPKFPAGPGCPCWVTMRIILPIWWPACPPSPGCAG